MCSKIIRLQQLDLESDKLAENFALPYTGIVWLQKISIHQGWLFGLYMYTLPLGISS